jgi:uncharacterized delta-60 repeat protein
MAKFSGWSLVLWLGASALISASAAQPGAVDLTFDPGHGPESVSPSSGNSVLVQSDGKILVAGEFSGLNLDFARGIVRFNPDGTLDGSFHASILPAPESAGYDYAPKLLALQPNGQVLLGGTLANPDGSTRFLTRLNSDGSVDNTFNPVFENGGGPAAVLQAKIVPGGRILIGGWFTSISGVSRNGLARLNADGSVDPTFNAAVFSKGFVVQSIGKPIVITGGNFTNGGDRLQRLNTDGSLDSTFAAIIPPSGHMAGGIFVQPDDKLIWTATWTGPVVDWPPTIISRSTADGANDSDYHPYSSYGGTPLFLQQDGGVIIFSGYSGASRLNPDGSPDSSFHPIALGYFAQQSDGRLVVTTGTIYTEPYGIRRLFLDGSSDNSFNPGLGLVSIRESSIDQARLLPNGKIVIAGGFNYFDRISRTRIAVLNANGSVDPNFDAGTLMVAQGNSTPFRTMTVQSDGKILIAVGDRLVRLGPDGVEDPTFHYSLIPNTSVWELGTQPTGKILLSDSSQRLKRLNPDGALDSTFPNDRFGNLVFVQPDAKILGRGATNNLFRDNADGSPDFGFHSEAAHGFLGPAFLGLQPNGMLLVARPFSSIDTHRFARLHPDGSLDQAFDPGFRSVGLAAADLTGIYFWASLTPWGYPDRLEIGRFLPNDSRDPNFAVQFNSEGAPNTLLIQPDGQLLVAGSFDHVNGVARASIARLNGAAPRKLANLSTRVGVSSGQRVEIGGFIIAGDTPKKVIVRALGPSLAAGGVIGSETLANPSLELHDSTGAVIGHNDDWLDTQEAEIREAGLPPVENAESAIVAVLAPGQYTAVVQGRTGEEGIALTEVYDLEPASDSSLANISTRGFVNDNNGVMIGGFILRGPESSTIVTRAIGPSLAAFGVDGTLADPILELHNGDGIIIGTNDNWRENEEEVRATGLAPENDLESAFVRILPPGAYTAIVRGAGDTTGVGLVEIYHLH